MKWRIAIVVPVMFFLLFSCKKEETTDTYLYMTGEVDYIFPAYTIPNQYIIADAGGILSPADVTWYWYSAKLGISTEDTVYGTHLEFFIPDSLGDYTLTSAAKKSGYYTKSKTCTTTVIDPKVGGESIGGFDLSSDSSFVDARDGRRYYCRKYGNLYWFTMNLNYAGPDTMTVGAAYQDSDSIGVIFGRLYTWKELTGGKGGSGLGGGPRGLCPEGWTVPTREDWTDFARSVDESGSPVPLTFDDKWFGMASTVSAPVTINGEKFWEYSPDNVPNNKYRWNAMPTGKSFNGYRSFECMTRYGFWWTSETNESGTQGYYRYIYFDSDEFRAASADINNIGFSVRCVKLAL